VPASYKTLLNTVNCGTKNQFSDLIHTNILKVAYGKMLRLQQDVHTFVVCMYFLMHLIYKDSLPICVEENQLDDTQ
jgi:hypothetical protein